MRGLLSPVAAFALLVLGLAGSSFAADTPRTPSGNMIGGDAQYFVWAGLDGDDTGVPVKVATCKRMTAHVFSSTYGSSTVTIEGTNDPAYATSGEWVGLTDPQGNAISKTADGIEAIEEQVAWIRPKTASGTGASVSVGLLCQH